jgi:uncharacterized phage protein (TIGR01671 family)
MGQRIIKFKAKKLSDGEWVEGDLYHNVRGFECCIGQQEKKGVFVYPVDPSTVCQFTGMRDCEGKEIWEGDIVRDNYDLLCVDNFYEVVYIEEEGAFSFKSLDKVDNYEPFVNLFEAYVVGNKFDKEK